MKKFLLMAVCAFSAMAVSAQRASSSSSSFFSTEKVDGGVQIGIRFGLNFANTSFKEDGATYSPSSRTGFHGGVSVDFPLVESLYIQSGLYLQSKGCKYDESDDEDYYKTTYNPMYLEIPVLASYRYNFSDAAQLQINFGPYFAYGIGGKIKTESSYSEENGEVDMFGDVNDGKADCKRFDCGLQIGGGITLANHYYVGVAYQFGLTDFAPDYEEDVKIKNKNWMVSVGYIF